MLAREPMISKGPSTRVIGTTIVQSKQQVPHGESDPFSLHPFLQYLHSMKKYANLNDMNSMANKTNGKKVDHSNNIFENRNLTDEDLMQIEAQTNCQFNNGQLQMLRARASNFGQRRTVTVPFQRNTAALGQNVLPIDDFEYYVDSFKYSEYERQQRIKAAAVYRLIEIFGWSMGIYNHVTVKMDDGNAILIHPYGLHYNEITASSLLKVDMRTSATLDYGSTNFELNRPGYLVHSAIHLARPDIKSVIHLHYPPVVAVSAFKQGLLPVCQEQALLGEIKYLDYDGILTDEQERDAVAKALGKTAKIMILRNHGLIVCGSSIEETFYQLQNLMKACETQVRLLSMGVNIEDQTHMVSKEAADQAYWLVQNASYPVKLFGNNWSDRTSAVAKVIGKTSMFEMDFEAHMRSLDNAGHRTGYNYKRPLIRRYHNINESS